MRDPARALEELLHDIRTPLGVAAGFVHLLREGRLDSAEARDRAWAGTSAALSRIIDLCNDATRHVGSTDVPGLESHS